MEKFRGSVYKPAIVYEEEVTDLIHNKFGYVKYGYDNPCFKEDLLVHTMFAKCVHIPYDTNEIIPNYFHRFPYLKQVIFDCPSSFCSLNNGLFYGRAYLEQISIPSSVTFIGN